MSPNAWVNKCDNMAAHTYIKVQYRAYFMCPTHRDRDKQSAQGVGRSGRMQDTGGSTQETSSSYYTDKRLRQAPVKCTAEKAFSTHECVRVCLPVCVCVCVCVLTAYDFVIKCCYKQTGRRHAHSHGTPRSNCTM